MKPVFPLVQWTPEIYLLFFFLYWTNTYSLDVNEINWMDYQTALPLVLTALLILQLFIRKRLLGIILTASMGLGSVILALNSLFHNWIGIKLDGPALSVVVFGCLVVLTNLTMVLWMGQKYRLIQVIND